MIEHLTKETFKEKVFDFDSNEQWKFDKQTPVIIDWFAQWCSPCKTLSPILEELSKEYEGKINIYKIDVDSEPELSAMFEIKSIPTMLFIPVGEDPQIMQGFSGKDNIEKVINSILKITK